METNATFTFVFILFENWGSPLQFSHQLIRRAAQEGEKMNQCFELQQVNADPQMDEMRNYLPTEPNIIARP